MQQSRYQAHLFAVGVMFAAIQYQATSNSAITLVDQAGAVFDQRARERMYEPRAGRWPGHENSLGNVRSTRIQQRRQHGAAHEAIGRRPQSSHHVEVRVDCVIGVRSCPRSETSQQPSKRPGVEHRSQTKSLHHPSGALRQPEAGSRENVDKLVANHNQAMNS